jgi:hypothetical protein
MTFSNLGNLAFLVLSLLMAACTGPSSSSAALPTEVTHAQLYAAADGETHFRDVVVSLTPIATAPPAQPFAQSELQPATTVRHAAFQQNWGQYDRDNNVFHTLSSRRFVSVRRGLMWVKASDGQTRRFQAGDVLEVLDVAPSKGHVTWMDAQPVVLLFSNLP